MTNPRRSRRAWASMAEEPPRPVDHVCRLPRGVRFGLLGLTAAVFLLLVAVAIGAVYVYQQQQYVEGKGVQRDRENARLEQQIRRSICDLLDQLPEGGLLDRPRAKYGCGPGILLDDLPADEAEELQRQRGGQPTEPPAPSPSVTGPGSPPQAAPGPPTTPPPASPAVPSSPPPVVDLGPARDMVCDSIRVCF